MEEVGLAALMVFDLEGFDAAALEAPLGVEPAAHSTPGSGPLLIVLQPGKVDPGEEKFPGAAWSMEHAPMASFDCSMPCGYAENKPGAAKRLQCSITPPVAVVTAGLHVASSMASWR